MHFWVFATRGTGGFSVPRKYGLNWFIPAFAKSKVGSFSGTTGLDATKVWPCFLQKKSMNCWRISVEVNMFVRVKGEGRSGNKRNVQRTTKILAAVRCDGGPGDHAQLERHHQDHSAKRKTDGEGKPLE